MTSDSVVSVEPTEAEFRAAGFTDAARAFPLSERAGRWLARFNGVPYERMPPAWHFAPNAYMLEYCEARAGAETLTLPDREKLCEVCGR